MPMLSLVSATLLFPSFHFYFLVKRFLKNLLEVGLQTGVLARSAFFIWRRVSFFPTRPQRRPAGADLVNCAAAVGCRLISIRGKSSIIGGHSRRLISDRAVFGSRATGAVRLNVFEQLLRTFQHRVLACVVLPAANGHVAQAGIIFDGAGVASGLFGRNDGGSAAGERIEYGSRRAG